MNPRDMLTSTMQMYENREEPERLYALAGIYWRVMLFIEVIVLCAAFAAGAYLLVMTFFTLTLNKSQGRMQQGLNPSQLSQVIQNFDTRKTLFETIATSSSTAADPAK